MTSATNKYYTYKITFKDLPCYFYYGVHRDNGNRYLGSPQKWKHLWKQFEPEIQILQWFDDWDEARKAEHSIITATWDSKYSLNAHNTIAFSGKVLSENGKKTVHKMLAHPNRKAGCIKAGQKSGPINAKKLNAHPNTKRAQRELVERTSKPCKIIELKTGKELVFSALRQGCIELGLNYSLMCATARGGRTHHRGHRAEYL